ncbi:MAG: DUF885 domain-containing protein [Flavobacteriales bacterium]
MRSRSVARVLLLVLVALPHWSAAPAGSFSAFAKAFTTRYAELGPEPYAMDIHERLKGVPDAEHAAQEADFFREQQGLLSGFDRTQLRGEERLLHDLIAYEIDYQQQRIALEQRWMKAGRPMPERSLYELPDRAEWYALFVRRYTGTDITPEQVFALGERETQRCQREIASLRKELGFADSASFQRALADQQQFLTDTAAVNAGFARIDSTVRTHLQRFVGEMDVPVVHAHQWPNAGPNTPPGIYLGMVDSTLHTYLFQYNFRNGRYNKRAMGWLYMHEAIPGHHLQSVARGPAGSGDLRDQLFYPGTAEGWACYVEYFGQELGVYDDPYQRLGKWEWDLVRSLRLVLDAGIHYYGWSHERALAYWKANIAGQDDIAEREVRRVTNWAAQALSYKVGADRLQQLRDKMQAAHGAGFSAARFHRAFLDMGQVPMAVVEQDLAERMGEQDH